MFSRWILCLLTLTLTQCASRQPSYREQGWASYVADHYTGRPTSSGQLYHPQAFTAAHTSLPFGTVVTVKNIMNGRTVNVTVNDRFPYYQGRVINLSSAAAQHIGIPYMQMGQVEITANHVSGGGGYYPASQAPAPAYGWYAPQPNYATPPSYAPPQGYPPTQTYPSYPPTNSGYSYSPPPTSSPAPAPNYPKPSGGYLAPQTSTNPSAPRFQGGSGTPPGLKTF